MKPKFLKICGKIATQPVVEKFEKNLVVLILVETEKGYLKFCCKTSTSIKEDAIETQLPKSMFSDVALSAVGDDVVLYVLPDAVGKPSHSIQNFINNTKKLGRFF